MHAQDDLPTLVRAGLLHAQFETSHPYLDGNGRVGRLLIALLLSVPKRISQLRTVMRTARSKPGRQPMQYRRTMTGVVDRRGCSAITCYNVRMNSGN